MNGRGGAAHAWTRAPGRRMLPRMLRRTLALVALSLLGCSSSSGDDAADAAPSVPAHVRTDPDSVFVVGATFRDGRGRQLLFRGFNLKDPGVFDVTFDDGRAPRETIVAATEADFVRMEQLGLNVIRLPVSWSGLEPHPGAYADAFQARIDTILGWARAHGVRVFVDMHQDAYSKEIGEDGAPLWAIVPPPSKLVGGPYDDAWRSSPDVVAATLSFARDDAATDGRLLQDAFAAAVTQVVARHLGDPALLGYEILNEPVFFPQAALDPFYAQVADAVHALDPDAPVLFEPLASRNQFDQALVPTSPWSHGPGVYAPHVYTGWFSSVPGWQSDLTLLAPSMQKAAAEAAAWGTPLFVTELGGDQSGTDGPLWLGAELDLQDRSLASSTIWVWREGGSWGLMTNDGVEHAATVKVVARPFPRAVAGDLVSIERPDATTLRVRYHETDATRGLPHELSLSADVAKDATATCNGAPATLAAKLGRAELTCPAGSSLFEVRWTAP